MRTRIHNGLIINEGKEYVGYIIIDNNTISHIADGVIDNCILATADRIIDAEGCWVMPGVIDDQVHFREPGLTHKADIGCESRAAVAGGVTSYMDMPNTKPATVTATTCCRNFTCQLLVLHRCYQRQCRVDHLTRLHPCVWYQALYGLFYRQHAGR